MPKTTEKERDVAEGRLALHIAEWATENRLTSVQVLAALARIAGRWADRAERKGRSK
jgi:hypothetical protein